MKTYLTLLTASSSPLPPQDLHTPVEERRRRRRRRRKVHSKQSDEEDSSINLAQPGSHGQVSENLAWIQLKRPRLNENTAPHATRPHHPCSDRKM
jgi:hypothetical protein